MTTAIALAMATAAPAAAQSQAPRFSLTFDLGADLNLAGNVHDGGTGTVLGLATSVGERSYGDVYGTPFTWNLTFGVRARPNTEIRARYFRTTADASELQVGTVANFALNAQFDDYAVNGMDLGVRQYYGTRVQPYVGASVGFARVKAISGTFSVPAASVVLPNVAMYDDSTVLTFAIQGGVLIPVSRNVGLQAGFDARWLGDLNPIDGLAGTGLEPINDQSRRWSMPVTFGAVIRF
jgi:opacity protein-like surface antigen